MLLLRSPDRRRPLPPPPPDPLASELQPAGQVLLALTLDVVMAGFDRMEGRSPLDRLRAALDQRIETQGRSREEVGDEDQDSDREDDETAWGLEQGR